MADGDAQVIAAAEIAVAQTQSAGNVGAANVAATASVTNTSAQVGGVKYSADQQLASATVQANQGFASAQVQANAQVQAVEIGSTLDNQARLTTAQLKLQGDLAAATATVTVSQNQATAQETASQQQADASKAVAVTQATADTTVATTQAGAATTVASTNAGAQVSAAGLGANAQVASSTLAANAQTAAATTQAQGDISVATINQNAETGRLSTTLAFAEDKFDKVFPFIQGTVTAGLFALITAGTPYVGLFGPPPFISARGVFSPAEVQQQVNTAYARNDSKFATVLRLAQGDLAGRGFSSNSPLLDALRVGLAGQNARANNEASTQIRFTAAQANRSAEGEGQVNQSSQYNQQQQAVIEAERNQVQRQVGILSGIAQMVGAVA